MDALGRMLFEVPWIVYLLCGLGELVAVAVWQQTRARKPLVMMAVWPVVALAAFLVASLVETDYEKVQARWKAVGRAVEAQDTDALMDNVAPDFRAGGLDRERFRRFADTAFQFMSPDGLRTTDLRFDNDIAPPEANGTIKAGYHDERFSVPPAATTWELTFARQDDGRWLLSRVDCIQPAQLNLRTALGQLRRGLGR